MHNVNFNQIIHLNKLICISIILANVPELQSGKFHCELFFADKTIVTLNDASKYFLLKLSSPSEEYSVYFAKDCKFPTPKSGKVFASFICTSFQIELLMWNI